jgi:hypothetical protein
VSHLPHASRNGAVSIAGNICLVVRDPQDVKINKKSWTGPHFLHFLFLFFPLAQTLGLCEWEVGPAGNLAKNIYGHFCSVYWNYHVILQMRLRRL